MAKKPTYEELRQRIKELEHETVEPKRAEERIKRQSEFLNSVLDSLPHPFYVIDAFDYTVMVANTAAHEGPLSKNTTCYALTHKRDRPCGSERHPCPLETIKETKQPVVVEHLHYDNDGNLRNVELHAYPVFDSEGNVSQIIESSLDITDRKRAEEAIRQSEDKYQDLYDNAPDMFASVDAKTERIVQCNRTTATTLGYSKEEIIGRHISELYHPDCEKARKQAFRLFVETGEVRDAELQLMRKDGSSVDVSLNVSAVRDKQGRVLYSRSIWRDITEGKRAKEMLQEAYDELERRVEERTAELRRLSSRLILVQESERKRIARELHDSLGQFLAAIKFGLENAINKMPENTAKDSIESFNALIPLIQQASDDVRRMHADLRPGLLDDLGIIATISWFCREFERLYSDIRIEKQINIEEKEVPDSLKTVIFRILQEALHNVAKHAKAGLVRVALTKADDHIDLFLQDNGQGFYIDQAMSLESSERGFGLTSMKERAELSGGSLAIESTPGAGTTIRASWQEGVPQ